MITKRKRKKSRKMRGRTRHQGRGITKGHKKHGIRGGKGNSNRDNAEKLKRFKIAPEKFLGKYGFTSPKAYRGINVEKYKENVVNVGRLDAMADRIGEQKGDAYVIDLKKLGIRKLLGSGKVTKKLIVRVDEASEIAIKKIEEAGGKVELSETPAA